MINIKTVNKLLPSHQGEQPIRVLQELIPYTFENTYPDFLQLSEKVIQQNNLQPGVRYHLGNETVETPFAENGEIHIHETFLSYAWCVTYALITLYREDFPNHDYVANKERVTEALNLFDYGMSLIKMFSIWDKDNLPNPEQYSSSIEEGIEIVNAAFLWVMNYILCHEFAHIEMDHAKKRTENGNRLDFTLQTEEEADKRALELMLNGTTNNTKEIISISMVIGLSCLLYFRKTTINYSGTHPDTDNRIHTLLEYLNPEPLSPIWGIAYFAYRLWDWKFFKGYSYPHIFSSNKGRYYHFYNQVQCEKQTIKK